MSIRELKDILKAKNISFADCFEKQDLSKYFSARLSIIWNPYSNTPYAHSNKNFELASITNDRSGIHAEHSLRHRNW